MAGGSARSRTRKRWRPLSARIGAGAAAWLAVFCIFVQLAASAACLRGAAPDARIAGVSGGPWPICHAHHDDRDDASSKRQRTPADEHSCPYCALHCHGAVAAAPEAPATRIPARAFETVRYARSDATTAVLLRHGASARGPPETV